MFRALLLVLALLTLPAATVIVEHARTTSSYTGPGDIVSGATAWYGLRAYNAAYAATPGLAVNIRRASDNVACDFNVSAAGGFGVTTATCNSSTQGGVSFGTFVGSDGTASCTLAGTTGACTGASGTVHVNDVVTGTGLTQPCIVATASNTAPTIEIAGTTNSCGAVGVAETFTFQVAGFVTEAYDQSGSSLPVSQATAGNQPQFLPLCLNGGALPCISHVRASSQFLTRASMTVSGQPFTYSGVIERTTVSAQAWLAAGTAGGATLVGFNSSANTAEIYAGTAATVGSVADGVLHAVEAIFNSTTSTLYIDGTGHSSLNAGTSTVTSGVFYFGNDNFNDYLNGYIGEAGYWGSLGFSGAQDKAMCSNKSVFYGMGLTCN